MKCGKLEKLSKSCLEAEKNTKEAFRSNYQFYSNSFVYLYILWNILMYSSITFFFFIRNKNTYKLLQILMQNHLVSQFLDFFFFKEVHWTRFIQT